MTWPTHTLLGISALWLLTLLPPELLGYDFGTLAACAALGALLPDLDASESKIKHLKLLGTNFKPFWVPAQIVSRTEQHRGLLHSLTGMGMMALISCPSLIWLGWPPVATLLLGYASHVAADAMTKSGVRFFYPSRNRYYLLPKSLRFTTGSLAEDALTAVLSLPVIVLLLRHLL